MVYEFQRLRAEHEVVILNFELSNRDYFAQMISDRGDEYFEQFAERHRELLVEQETGGSAFYVLVDEDGTVVGRFNLYDIGGGSANVGYRVARDVSGRGVATYGLQNLCQCSIEQFGLRKLNATTSNENVASRRVLEKSGFVVVGTAMAGNQLGVLYELELATSDIDS
jgi:ribosomal-protein-alanine N-acetyltransferase